MKATTHLGPFLDSSLPVYLTGNWYQANYEYKYSLSIWEDIPTDFTVLKSDLNQLYVTIEGKEYLVSAPLSMMSELLGREVEGDLKNTARRRVPYNIKTGEPGYNIDNEPRTYFFPKQPEAAQSLTNKESEKPIFGEWQLQEECIILHL